jgi:hypothetical protein
MRVVYRTLREELDEAIASSTLQGRRIARFELTECEFEQLKKELDPLCVYRTVNNPHPHSIYNGIPIKVIE